MEKRFKVFFAFLAAVSLTILARYGYLMLKPAPGVSTVSFPEVERGPILDRNGRLLALQTELNSVEAWLPSVESPDSTARLLASTLSDMSYESIYSQLTGTGSSNFLYIKRKISPTETMEIQKLIGEGRLKGISIRPEYGRNYPEKDLASHVIGYTGTDNVGLEGIEYKFNSVLSPPVISSSQDILYGNQVYLTIDSNIQYITEKIARKAYVENKAEKVMILLMEAKTGDLLSYVSIPSFDPNNFQQFSRMERENHPVSYAYEPGSVFKIFSVASFLELGGITAEDTFDTTGGYNPEFFKKNRITPITDLGSYGVLNAEKTLVYSSNVGVSYMSETVDSRDYYNMLKNFGFGQTTGITLNGESSGILFEPEKWSLRSKPTISFGQEIGVSAIQVISAATVFANSGILLKPHIVKKVVAPDGTVIKEYGREPVREVLSPEVADSVLHMMQKVTEEGTARRARIEGFNISAKTGTAQIPDKETGKYSTTEYLGSILAIFPTDDPEIIVYIVIDRPMGDYTYGGRIGSPLVKELAEELIPLMGLDLATSRRFVHTGNIRLSKPELKSTDGTMPDMKGYSKRAVLEFLKEYNLKGNLKGEGWVVFQFPPAGPESEIKDEMTVYVEFK
ncbi:MAG: PASTA domain-containing protein [Calditrichaeota bacterium]|nr:transpeptidase family protein [Spirochaetales bacterium]RQV98529.1 MAG: PASTA domain-containing protein [Calditrichota bacterium]